MKAGKSRCEIKSASLKFNIVGFCALAAAILMWLFLLIDYVSLAVVGSMFFFAVGTVTFRVKESYLALFTESGNRED